MADVYHQWRLPLPDVALSSSDVHVWRVVLDQPTARVQQLAQILSDDERARANRFYFERDKKRFIVARGILRTILGRYLDVEPGHLQFCYGPHGKPYLAERFGGGMLRFNLAHSHRLALYAFPYGREAGVDLEYVRLVPDIGQIAARFFSARENAVLFALPANQQQEAFFNCWTRKEAYVKAIGDGLAQPLDRFDVSLAPGEPAQLLSVDGNHEEASRWSLEALAPAPGYMAALAVQGCDWCLTCWQYP